MLSKLLFFRFILFNICVLVAFSAMEYYGWISDFVRNDTSNISLAIIIIFAGTLIYQGIRAWKISRMIDVFKYSIANDTWQAQYKAISHYSIDKLVILREKDLKKISWMHYIAVWLAVMGFIGTVVGFIIATSGVPSEGVNDVEGVNSLLGYLINGVSIALYTTLAGAVAGLIVEINASKIETALFNFWCDLIEKIG